eukprot:scaffold139335_cov130-Phaeocystis_antarctica.AAC.1
MAGARARLGRRLIRQREPCSHIAVRRGSARRGGRGRRCPASGTRGRSAQRCDLCLQRRERLNLGELSWHESLALGLLLLQPHSLADLLLNLAELLGAIRADGVTVHAWPGLGNGGR